MQPGDTIQPGTKPDTEDADSTISHDAEPTAAPKIEPAPSNLQASPSPVSASGSGESTESAAEEYQPQSTPWQYAQDYDTSLVPPSRDFAPVSWTASEFVDHEKSPSWFISLAALSGAFITIIYFITREIASVIVIGLAAVLFGITAGRKPRTLQYQISDGGINIGNKFYPYAILKAFSVLEEGAFNSIQLSPLKRFMPPISLYYPPEEEQKIVQMLANYLPHEERTHDPIDRLMRRVRF